MIYVFCWSINSPQKLINFQFSNTTEDPNTLHIFVALSFKTLWFMSHCPNECNRLSECGHFKENIVMISKKFRQNYVKVYFCK